ncbi:MAG: MG2 domain-containing protein [Armatimonadota bacterium]
MRSEKKINRLHRYALCLFGLLGILFCTLLLRDSQQALSAGTSPLETRILGQSRWLRGGPAALRVIVTDHRTGAPLVANVTISMVRMENGKPAKDSQRLYAGKTGAYGTLDAQFKAPVGEPGTYQLAVKVESALGIDEISQSVQIEESVQVMLSMDKPLYQPGQTMHLRALALDTATRQTVTGDSLVFEVEDARGNKVFKKRQDLSDFGVASADFELANEVNMGTYTVRAILPQGQAEKKVRVERYVLPKFKVALTTDKSFYLPGETVKGTIQTDYFFGKPVAGGEVTIDVNTYDISVTKLAELQGKTDTRGTYKFEYVLPQTFVGQPFEQGKGIVEFHGAIIDAAEHQQEVNTAVPVVKDPILLLVVPESRALVPGIKNRVFIAAASPSGAPLVKANLSITTSQTTLPTALTTDALGLAVYEFVPGKDAVTLTVRATNADGQTATATQKLDTNPSQEGIILRSNKSLAKVGDRVTVAAISSTKSGTIYFDMIRNKQTILTKAMAVNNGQASVTINVTHDMIGTVEMHAYKILPNEDIIRDSQIMIVTPADDLQIAVKTDKTVYRPGEDAKITFTVTDAQQHPILAALGVAIVDESVFALSELKPGLEKIYFTLEKELMEPKYEIHGLKPVDLILPPGPDPRPVPLPRPILMEGQRQLAAQVLFAGVPRKGDFDIRVNTYQQRVAKLRAEVAQDMEKALEKIRQAVNKYREATKQSLTADQTLFYLVEKGYLKIRDLKDRWGNYYKTELYGARNYDNWFTLSSAGPDGRWGTIDDITAEQIMKNRWGRGGVVGLNAIEQMDMPGIVMKDGAAAGAPAPMAMAMKGDAVDLKSEVTATAAEGGAEEPVRIREYFPETMYWNPSIITDEKGIATVSIPMADSITTWRMSTIANSVIGQLGSGDTPLRVFQDFFVDIDLPVSLTQNDKVSIPVAVYNYLPEAQQVTLTLEPDAWYALDGDSEQVIDLQKDQVKVVYYPITVKSIGHYPLTVKAKGTKFSDAVRRSIDVLPDGKEFRPTINDRLDGKVTKTVTIPADSIDGASTVWVKLYPGAFSQIVEGLDGILRMPSGCFEQTSSTTYPNILVLDYLKKLKKINPELQMKAEQYINVGYQRLVTYECKGGGFSWFGNDPAHQILTAYGLLEFSDMAKVHDVDPALITRTQNWLAGKQLADGTWEVKEQGIAEGIIDRQTGALRATSYIAWALAESGFKGAQLDKAVTYVTAHRNEAKDPYTLAVILNLYTCINKNSEDAAQVAQQLINTAKADDKSAYWVSDSPTFTGAKSEGADLETTGMAAYGLVKWGRNSGFLNKVLNYLVQSKNSFGTWSTTQGTVWSMKALIHASTNAAGGLGTVDISCNGKKITTIKITEDDSDVMRQIDLAGTIQEGANTLDLQYTGDGSVLYQIVGRYYIPWNLVANEPEGGKGPMSIDVAYDKTTLAQDDTATVTVTIKCDDKADVEMPLIDVGVPPGFTVVSDQLEAAVQAKTISKYTIAARQIIIYMEKLEHGKTVTLKYQLKAKYPIKARTPLSKAYPYYNPEKATVSAPQSINVRK